MRQAFPRKLFGLAAAGWAVRCQVATFAYVDKHNLQRFVDAQASPVYEGVRTELQSGKKKTHWMWFIFPQISGLGRSDKAIFYSIRSREEERNAHFTGCSVRGFEVILHASGSMKSAFPPADLSSLTLFDQVEAKKEFDSALQRFFDGKRDMRTLEILNEMAKDSDL
ncbi:hypothetical protein AK812_SmicGene1163 [Symbiodinium microadriaticum]|uniref:Calpastatin n=1 Tax=Symbiodinium microadriaticum TaxID=2951 RepID=A0A1Q9F4L5_SYMMI|nr:hypothetical protein AK812_SmicGene1163 [Symbiodinium microadriaticum]